MANQSFIRQFQTGTTLSRQELANRLRLQYPTAKPTTIDWHIYGLLQQGLLAKAGRDNYQVIDKTPQSAFGQNVPLPKPFNTWLEPLQVEFPYLTICLWSTRWLQPLLMHVPLVEYWLIEVEREAVDAVYAFCQRTWATGLNSDVPVVRATDWPVLESYLADTSTIAFIKPLISEAPLQPFGSVTTITVEKLIVDLLADESVFFLYQEELPRIIEGLTEHYVINLNRLQRYARRRNHLPQLQQLLATLPNQSKA